MRMKMDLLRVQNKTDKQLLSINMLLWIMALAALK